MKQCEAEGWFTFGTCQMKLRCSRPVHEFPYHVSGRIYKDATAHRTVLQANGDTVVCTWFDLAKEPAK